MFFKKSSVGFRLLFFVIVYGGFTLRVFSQRDCIVSWMNDTTYGTFVTDPKEVGLRRSSAFVSGHYSPLFKSVKDSVIVVTVKNTRFYYRERSGRRFVFRGGSLYSGYYESFQKEQFIPIREDYGKFELLVINNYFLRYYYVMKYCGIYILPDPTDTDHVFWVGKHTVSGYKLKYFFNLTIRNVREWLEEGEQFKLSKPDKMGYRGVRELIVEYNRLKFNELNNN